MPYINHTSTRRPDGTLDKTAINIASLMNEGMDYTFTVNAAQKNDAIHVLLDAWDGWWDSDPGLTMFEELELALTEAGIPFESHVNETEEDE